MAMQLEITCPDVFQRIGSYELDQPYTGDLDPSRFSAETYALWLYWSGDLTWLTVSGSVDGQPAEHFSSETGVVDGIIERYGSSREQMQPAKNPTFFDTNKILAVSARRGARINLHITVDTDNQTFQTECQKILASGGNELTCTIGVGAFSLRPGVPGGGKDSGKLTLKLRPLESLPTYMGVVALDLGNTNSTVVCLDSGINRTYELKVLHPEHSSYRLSTDRETSAIPSHVRVHEIVTWDSYSGPRKFPSLARDDFPQAVRWTIGALATVSGNQSSATVLGAKGLMAGRRAEETMGILTDHNNQYPGKKIEVSLSQRVDLVHRSAAELLACRLLQELSRAKGKDKKPVGWPKMLAITYPTTFSPREVERLRRTIYRAWLRSQFKKQRPAEATAGTTTAARAQGDPQLERCAVQLQQRLASAKSSSTLEDPLIGLELDEASAAAFFFIYRKVFESPGGLPVFGYHYPTGLNLLLYDCGGGTTDIALMRAQVDPENPARLRIGIRGRTGVRRFGGDNITLAVAKLLKAKLARVLAEEFNRDSIPPVPSKPEDGARPWTRRNEIETFLTRMSESGLADEYVPTKFARIQTDKDSLIRRERAETLWNLSQEVKHALAHAETVKLSELWIKMKVRFGPNLNKLAEVLLKHYPANSQLQNNLSDELSKVSISRWEIDATIGPIVLRSVLNCNELIRDRLTRKPTVQRKGLPDDEEYVHWVVATGNGSRYPLVRQLLQDRLDVPFPGDDPPVPTVLSGAENQKKKPTEEPRPGWRVHFEPENMKNAVAKGAALALASIRGRVMAEIRFDTVLSDCLPFDVAYWHRNNQDVTLFEADTRYDQLGKKLVRIANIRATVPLVGEEMRNLRSEFSLMRRFPGDGANPAPQDGIPVDEKRGWESYQTFDFGREGIQGDLEVRYDLDTHEFVAKDLTSGKEIKGREDGSDEDSFPYAQSGTL